jgi:hypothetical protein
VSTLSRQGRGAAYRKVNWRNGPACPDQRSPEWSAPPATSALKPSSESQMLSALRFRHSSCRSTKKSLTIGRSPHGSIAETMSSLTQPPFSALSTKRRGAKSNDIVEPGAQDWSVKLHAKVIKTIAAHGGLQSGAFRPDIGDLIDHIRQNPKQFPKKQGALRDLRAADVIFADGMVWRAVYTLDEATRTVRVVALGPHDAAYRDAERRL